MTKVNSMGKRLGAAVMACAMAMAMAVSAGAVDVSDAEVVDFAIEFQQPDGSPSMANSVLTDGKATYNEAEDTLTFDITPLEMEYAGQDMTGCLTEVTVSGDVKGVAEFGADQMVIENFDLSDYTAAENGQYNITTSMKVVVKNAAGEEIPIPPMANIQAVMVLAA